MWPVRRILRVAMNHAQYIRHTGIAALPRSVFLLLLVSGFLIGATGCRPVDDTGKPTVVTSIAPLGDWMREIAGDHLNVVVIVPPNGNPHTFELRPQQLREAAGARLLVLIGAGFEYWEDELLANMDKRVRVMHLSDGHDLLQDDDHAGGHDGHGHAAGNPHLWLDPVFARQAVDQIAQELSGIFPDLDTAFTRNSQRYMAELHNLDAEIRRKVSSWKYRRFVADHSSWVYFSRRYGLRQEGVIEETPGREISAREMSALIRRMKRRHVHAIFADIRKSSHAVDVLAEETGARVAYLDPIGSRQTADSYIELMHCNVDEMRRALR